MVCLLMLDFNSLSVNVKIFILILTCCGIFGCTNDKPISSNNFDLLELDFFVEDNFPFFSTCLDARDLGDMYPSDNLVARGLTFALGKNIYGCFDTDLLRWSVIWAGEQLPMVLLPQVSYHDFFDKSNDVPRIKGDPIFANGLYPGLSLNEQLTNEVRGEEQEREGFYWGALPMEYGRWEGIYTYGSKAILSYMINDIGIHEIPTSIDTEFGPIFKRDIEIDASSDVLFLNIAEFLEVETVVRNKTSVIISEKMQSDSITVISVFGDEGQLYPIHVKDNRWISVEVPFSVEKRKISIHVWKGLRSNLNAIEDKIRKDKLEWPLFGEGGPSRWGKKIITKGNISPDTAAFVIDELTLPIPNTWKRNVRVTDIAFIEEDELAVLTFEGDVWIVNGISDKLNRLEWRRYASGLFEPMSILVKDHKIYVYGKEGIVRLHDLNGDGEADFYENFSNVMNQSIESREWATDMVMDKEGNFYIAKGGTAIGGPGITPKVTTGFRAGSNQSGTIMRISSDGKKGEIFARGLRVPYLGIRELDNQISITDQQGNFVPSTPIYLASYGDYFGVPATKHTMEELEPKRPLTWIPHKVDRSASSEIWLVGGEMGPLNNQLLHLSFGRPGVFKVHIDTTSQGLQGGVSFIDAGYLAPTIKGVVGPLDGQLYLAGMNLFGSNSNGISAIQRLRYTEKPSYLLEGFHAGKEGVILSFDFQVEEQRATDPTSFRVKRWNYKRTENYGSGHYRYDGEPGEEVLPVLSSYLSKDGKKIFLLLPDMKEIDQIEIQYNIQTAGGETVEDELWFSLFYVEELDIIREGFEEVSFEMLKLSREEIASMIETDLPTTVDRGQKLFKEVGCSGCHSTGKEKKGMYGPPFQGIYGSHVELSDGTIIQVDESYLRESILRPSKKIVKGYNDEMPSYEGILTTSDLESIILYIKTLYR